jgi:hypothetical protein
MLPVLNTANALVLGLIFLKVIDVIGRLISVEC